MGHQRLRHGVRLCGRWRGLGKPFSGNTALSNGKGWGWYAYALAIILALSSTSALAQPSPWITYDDALSPSSCSIVNADNAELVVLRSNGHLMIVSGSDVELVDTFVDVDGNVFFEGVQAGFIDFAFDGDGFRTLWWTGLTGEVVRVNGFTGEPTPTDSRPDDFHNVPCDACDFWDDPADCEENPPIIIRICGQSIVLPLILSVLGLIGLGNRPTRRPRLCAGLPPD